MADMARCARTEDEVNDLLNRVQERIDDGETFRGMTFERGISDAIDWLLDAGVENPLGE